MIICWVISLKGIFTKICTDSFVALQNSEHFSETMKKLCLLANVDLNERNGPVTRSMTTQMRQLIEFVQQLVDYNNYKPILTKAPISDLVTTHERGDSSHELLIGYCLIFIFVKSLIQ